MSDFTQLHSHPHSHAHSHAPATPRPVPFSLLRLSMIERLVGAAALIALIWGGVFWALHA
jgi:hypothetical protein